MKTMTSPVIRTASIHGMDAEAKAALFQLENLARTGKIAVAGRFMPDAGISHRLDALGIAENIEEADFFRYTRIVIPFSGISPKKRKEWEKAGVPVTDLTSPQIRRSQVALGLLRMDGAQTLVIGRHWDAESKALVAGNPGTRIIEDTTDTARLAFAPAFGVVCQTTLSPRRVAWLVQQLRHRYNDAKVTFLDTTAPSMTARDRALERLLSDCDRVIIAGQAGEASCEALAETALRKGKPSSILSQPEELDAIEFSSGERIALTAGAFVMDPVLRAFSEKLAWR